MHENTDSYSFDMNGGKEREDSTDIAGDWVKIHYNTFRPTDVKAVVTSGKPAVGAEIQRNWFLHMDIKSAVT